MTAIEIDKAIASIPSGGTRVILGSRITKAPGRLGSGFTYVVEGVERPWTRRILLNFLTRSNQR